MVCSMTAFARANSDTDYGSFTWELRSVNSRYLELHLRLPDEFRDLEPLLRERLQKNLKRGKVECFLRFQPKQGQQQLAVNIETAQQVIHAAQTIQDLIGQYSGPMQLDALNSLDILKWPGVLNSQTPDKNAQQQAALTAFDQCLSQSVTVRQREGAELVNIIGQRVAVIREILAQLVQHMPQALAVQQQKLQEKLAELPIQVEAGRLEAEIVLLTQKADIAEELDRLRIHLDEVERALTLKEPVGRKLDFMMQELNREANTLSSKALSITITQAAVELKVLIEQMREQIQNIE